MSQNIYIHKQKKIIDNKVMILSDYVSSNKRDITQIIDSLISGTITSHSDIDEHLEDLIKIKSNWCIEKDGDLVGYIYQQLRESFSKKKTGQFFTPTEVVKHITARAFSNIEDPEKSRILDPACGSGQFLIHAFLYLKNIYLEKGYTLAETESFILSKNLFGIDIDPIAIKIAKHNLYSLCESTSVVKVNITKDDYLFLDDMKLSPHPYLNQIYTHIIGNPPWGSKFSQEDKKYFKKNYISAKSGVNSFSLFIERSQDFIKDNGTIAFQIPEAFLNIKAHMSLRKELLRQFKIDSITLWGDVFKNVYAPSISLILSKTQCSNARNSHIVSIEKKIPNASLKKTLIPQSYYNSTFQNIYSITYSKLSVSLTDSMHNMDCTYLCNRAAFFLGIVTGNNEHHLSKVPGSRHSDPIIIGSDLKQFQINYSDHYFTYNPNKLQQVAPQKFYLTQNKILYKFIGKRLTFALDREGKYSLNNVNGFIPLTYEINPETLISILNSTLMQYYYENTFFTLKVLRGNLERLPVKRISRSNQILIKKYHDILSIERPENTEEIIAKIEDIVFHEYGVTDTMAEKITTLVNS